MASPDLQLFLSLGARMADEAGDIARRYFRTPIAVETKKDDSPVTAADREIESAIRGMIRKELPGHGILGEEEGAENIDCDFTWVIDPIDGTLSFISGVPAFGILIGLCHKGTPILGIIDQPILKERWIGIQNKSSVLNNKPIAVRACPALSKATICTTSPYLFTADEKPVIESLLTRAKERVFSKDCYAAALVAAGFADIMIESGLKAHDFCALAPVIEGAGGIITDWKGKKLTMHSDGRILACGDKRLHEEILKELSEL